MLWLKRFFLRRKLGKVRALLARQCAESVSPVCAFGGGKNSVVLLHLLHELGGAKFPCRAMRLNTAQAVPELDEFVAQMGRRWGLEILTLELAGLFPEQAASRQDFATCCRQLRVDGLARAAQLYKFDTVFTGLSADDAGAREIVDARARLGEDVVRWVDPLYGLSQADIELITQDYGLPTCMLYDGSTSQVSCLPCAELNSLS